MGSLSIQTCTPRIPSGDAYTSRFDIITADFKDVSRCVDDSLLCSKDIESAFWETYEYIKHCSDNGIVFNVDKFQFAADVCEYAGFELVPDGFRPPERKLKVIKEFPCPKTITDVRSWFGLINQFKYACKQINYMSPLRDLLKKKGAQFYWDDTLTNIFEKSKEAIIEAIKEGVKSFERNRVTCIAADYSKTGLGYTLSQKYCSCDVLVEKATGESPFVVHDSAHQPRQGTVQQKEKLSLPFMDFNSAKSS